MGDRDMRQLALGYDPASVILADPDWQYEVWSEKGKGRSAENHYSTSPLEELKTIPVRQLAAKNSVLLMWATWPTILQAFELGKVWGFEYKTAAFVWCKTNRSVIGRVIENIFAPSHWFIGNGHYTRANTEPVLLFTRGDPIPRKSKAVRQLVVEPIQVYDEFDVPVDKKIGEKAHSKKPAEVHRRIEQLFDGPYIELFARRPYEGWFCLGDELDGMDMLESIPRLVREGQQGRGYFERVVHDAQNLHV